MKISDIFEYRRFFCFPVRFALQIFDNCGMMLTYAFVDELSAGEVFTNYDLQHDFGGDGEHPYDPPAADDRPGRRGDPCEV